MHNIVSNNSADPPLKGQLSILALFGVALSVLFAAMASHAFTRDLGSMAAIWPVNAIVVAVMLRCSRASWPAVLAVALAGNVAADLIGGDALITTIQYSTCNNIEIFICTLMITKLIGQSIDLGQQRHVVLFIIIAGLISPSISSAINIIFIHKLNFSSTLAMLFRRYARDALGLLTVIPALLALTPETITNLRLHLKNGHGPISAIVLSSSLVMTFGQNSFPFLFLVPPALILVAFELELAGAALALLVTAFVTVTATLNGHGPIMLIQGDRSVRLAILELFLATATLSLLPVAAALAKRARLESALRLLVSDLEAARDRIEQSEARYRIIAEKATDIISRTAIDGRLIYLSPSITAVLGLKAEDLIGHSLIPRIHPDDVEPYKAFCQQIISDERAGSSPVLYRIRHRDGHWVWLECNLTLVRDIHGTPVEFIGIRRDISGRVRMEAELRAARDAAQTAASVKAEFLANMSHEIRTPLTAIIGFTALLSERSDLDELARSYVERIAGAGRVLRAVVNDVLDFSKLEVGQFELKPSPVSPADTLRETLLLFSHEAETKGLTLTFQGGGSLPANVMIDADRLRQVLFNLLSNAIKFTDAGSVILATSYVAKRQQLKVRVADTGAGLTKGQRQKLFQRFSQVDASTTRRHGGTGLGLAICKGLVEAMGGAIGVRSKVGLGSVFYFEISAPRAEALARTVIEDAGMALEGFRILVADDNLTNLELTRAILTPLGVELSEVADGAAAVEATHTALFDLILMDVRMPGLDGAEAAKQIRQGGGPNQDIPILAFSAELEAADLAGAFVHFDGAVRKPLVREDLISTLLQHLRLDTGIAAPLETQDAVRC